MAIKAGLTLLEIIQQYVRRMMMGKGSGILKIPPKDDVTKFSKELLKKFKEHGVSDSAVNSPKDVKIIWEQITNKEAQVLRNNMTDLVKELDTPLPTKKSADVHPFTGFTPKVIKGGKKEGIAGIEQRAKKIEDINKKLKTMQEEKTTMYPGSVKTESGVETTRKRIFEIDDELEKLSYGEGKYAKMSRKERENLMAKLQDESSDLQKVPGIAESKWNDEFQNFQMNITKNSPEFNQDLTKKIINREMFKEATTEQRKQVLDALDFVRKNPEDIEPFASGGLARVGMFVGGSVWKKFIEKLFIKSSNDIRQGKGLFKGLNQEQMITQHDNLTKMLKKWEMSGKKGLPEGASQYLGVNDLQVSKAIKDATKKVKKVDKDRLATADELEDAREIVDPTGEAYMVEEGMTVKELDKMVADHKAYMADMQSQYMRGDLEKYVKPEILEESRVLRQKKIDKVLDKAYDEIAGGSGFSDDYKMAADELSSSIAEQLGKGEFSDLSQMYQTDIYNTALKRVTGDLKKKLSQPTKTLEGIKKEGMIDISDPEVADEFTTFVKESDPKGYRDLEQKIQLEDFDVTGRKKNASGGRIGFADGDEVFDPLEGAFDDILEDIKKQRRKRKAEELKDLKNWDPQSPTYHASGGIAGQLHMNQGGRAGFQDGALAAYQQGNPTSRAELLAGNYAPGTKSPMGYDFSDTTTKFKSDADAQTYFDQLMSMGHQAYLGKMNIRPSKMAPGRMSSWDGGVETVLGKDYYELNPDWYYGRGDWAPKTSTNVPGTPIVPTTAQAPATQASTPVAGDKSLLNKAVGAVTGEHFGAEGNREKLINAMKRGLINEEEYKRLSGYDASKEIAGLSSLGFMGDTANAIASGVYNLAKSAVAPEAYEGRIGPAESTALNIAGSKGLSQTEKDKYQGIMDLSPASLEKNPYGSNYSSQLAQRAGLAPAYDEMTPNMGISGVEKIARASQYGDSRMQAAADKGMDARMGRTYAENIQTMADPRMLQAKGGRASLSNGGLAKILGV